MDQALAQLIEVRTPREVIDAAIASSAIPLLFQPVRIAGRDYVDAGMFSSRVLHAVLADGADAILVVLMTPAEWRLEERGQTHLLEVGARLLELGNWRDLRGELLTLPASWSRSGDPARVCAVEPAEELPGGLLEFHPHTAQALIERGMEDTWRALERAGWLAPAAEAGEGQGGPVP
jgi:predicted acylesterase/phospholipase RssA